MKQRAPIRRAISITFLLLSVILFLFVILAASRLGFGQSWGDWLISGIPLVTIAICGLFSFLLFSSPLEMHPAKRGLLWGAFAGANSFLLLLAFPLTTQFDLLSQDGTAYWGLLAIPCIYIGIPALLAGSLAGMITGCVLAKTKRVEEAS